MYCYFYLCYLHLTKIKNKILAKDEEVKDNVVKKIEFSSFSDSQASSTFESASRLSLDDNSVECANLTDESINDASFVSPLPSDNCVFSTPCAKNEQNKIKGLLTIRVNLRFALNN